MPCCTSPPKAAMLQGLELSAIQKASVILVIQISLFVYGSYKHRMWLLQKAPKFLSVSVGKVRFYF